MSNPLDPVTTGPSPRLCAYCRKSPRVAGFAPFCSRGCQDRDLVQWMRQGYVVAATDNADELSDENQRIRALDNDTADG